MAFTIAEEIDELKSKIALLNGDKKAYSESSQWAILQNKERISRLRQENKELRTQFSKKMTADDDVILGVFHSHKTHVPAELRGVSGELALQRFDQLVCDARKKCNKAQHTRQSRQQTFDHLQNQLGEMQKEKEIILSTPAGVSEAAKHLQQLENRLDKVVVKCSETGHIRKTYETIIEKLQQECRGFDNAINDLKGHLIRRREQLRDLQSMCRDAEQARNVAKMELSRQEQSMSESRKEREKVINEYRKEANDKKEFKEKVERRIRRTSEYPTALGAGEARERKQQQIQEQEEKITSYEEALAKIKDATGVSDIQEVVDRFLNQGETRSHLEQLRVEHTQQLARLQEERERLQAQFEEMKYSGEAKMSSGQRMLEEFGSHLDQAKKTCDQSKTRADKTSKLLAQVKNGVYHLSEKLQHIKAPQTHVLKPQVDQDSEEYVLQLLAQGELKLVSLAEELASRDLDSIRKSMDDEEFRSTMERGASFNIKIELPTVTEESTFYDEESGSEEEFVGREAMKKATVALVEAKTKKKVQDDDEDEGAKKRKKR